MVSSVPPANYTVISKKTRPLRRDFSFWEMALNGGARRGGYGAPPREAAGLKSRDNFTGLYERELLIAHPKDWLMVQGAVINRPVAPRSRR